MAGVHPRRCRGAVTWRSSRLCWQRRGPVTWCWWRALSTGFGSGDVALLVGSLGAGGVDELAPVWPDCGH
jgi:hypothetical protein